MYFVCLPAVFDGINYLTSRVSWGRDFTARHRPSPSLPLHVLLSLSLGGTRVFCRRWPGSPTHEANCSQRLHNGENVIQNFGKSGGYSWRPRPPTLQLGHFNLILIVTDMAVYIKYNHYVLKGFFKILSATQTTCSLFI